MTPPPMTRVTARDLRRAKRDARTLASAHGLSAAAEVELAVLLTMSHAGAGEAVSRRPEARAHWDEGIAELVAAGLFESTGERWHGQPLLRGDLRQLRTQAQAIRAVEAASQGGNS